MDCLIESELEIIIWLIYNERILIASRHSSHIGVVADVLVPDRHQDITMLSELWL